MAPHAEFATVRTYFGPVLRTTRVRNRSDAAPLLSPQMWTDVAISPQVPTSPPVDSSPPRPHHSGLLARSSRERARSVGEPRSSRSTLATRPPSPSGRSHQAGSSSTARRQPRRQPLRLAPTAFRLGEARACGFLPSQRDSSRASTPPLAVQSAPLDRRF